MKKLLSFFLIFLLILLFLHLFWVLQKSINYFLYNNLEWQSQIEELMNEKKEKELINKSILEVNYKIKSYFNFLENKDNCYFEIKNLNDIVLNDTKWLNLDYKNIENPSWELDKIIKCNIYNSLTNNLYINIPYFYIKVKKEMIILNQFIEDYTKNWYKIHLIVYYSNNDLDKKTNNVFSMINQAFVTSLNLYYQQNNKNLDTFYTYKQLKKLEEDYIEEFSELNTNIWIYNSENNYETLKNIKENSLSLINWKYFLVFRDNYFLNKNENDLIQEIINTLELINENEMLLIHFDFLKENLDKIDILTLYDIIKTKNIKISIPNSIMYEEETFDFSEEENFKKELQKEYSSLTFSEIELMFLKEKVKFLEKKYVNVNLNIE